MTVEEFEARVWQVDRVRIVVRAPRWEEVGDYNYDNARDANHTLAIFLGDRVQPRIGDREVIAVDGAGQTVHGARRLRTLRASYQPQ